MTEEKCNKGGSKNSKKSNETPKESKKHMCSTSKSVDGIDARTKEGKKKLTIKELIPENEINLYHVYYNLIHRKDVSVCDEWMGSYNAFRDWAMDNGYKDGARIVRIDKTLPFIPDNTKVEVPSYNQNMKRLAAIAKGKSEGIFKFSYK